MLLFSYYIHKFPLFSTPWQHINTIVQQASGTFWLWLLGLLFQPLWQAKNHYMQDNLQYTDLAEEMADSKICKPLWQVADIAHICSLHLEWFDLVQSQVGIRAEDDRILVVARFGGGWKLQLHLENRTHTQNEISQTRFPLFYPSKVKILIKAVKSGKKNC